MAVGELPRTLVNMPSSSLPCVCLCSATCSRTNPDFDTNQPSEYECSHCFAV